MIPYFFIRWIEYARWSLCFRSPAPLAVTTFNFGGNVRSKQISYLTKEAFHELKEKGTALIYKPIEKHAPFMR